MIDLMQKCWDKWNNSIDLRNRQDYTDYNDYLLKQMQKAGMLPPLSEDISGNFYIYTWEK